MSHLLFAYAGPDQVMTVTSGLASLLGMLLIFWNKVVAFCARVINRLRGTPAVLPAEAAAVEAEVKDTPPQDA